MQGGHSGDGFDPSQSQSLDRTVIRRPTPGGRRPQAPGASPAQTPPAGPGAAPAAPAAPAADLQSLTAQGGTLLKLSSTLLVLAGELRGMASHPDVEGLHMALRREITELEQRARQGGVSPEHVLAARYCLCTFIDEAVLGTPWGAESMWSGQSLLSIFQNEVWGGEKFFQILDHMMQEPARNLDVLELLCACLLLGFQGKYQVLEGGRGSLERIQDNLVRTIRSQRGDYERELSPHWQGVRDHRNPLTRYVPLWVVGAFAGVVLLGVYMSFLFALNAASDPAFARVQQAGRAPVALPARVLAAPPASVAEPAPLEPPPPPAHRITLRELLQPEIRQGVVELRETEDETAVVIRGDGLFPSGSASVKPEYVALLERIAEALGEVGGKVTVTGHTDSIPIRTLRFPSNWHLSQARADAVMELMLPHVGAQVRISAEGRAEAEPLAPNDTPANRALNRRVEVILRERQQV